MQSEFREDQYQLAYPDGIEHHWWNRSRSRFVADLIVAATGGNAPIIEVGAGRGVAVKHLRKFGLPCDGVELADVMPLSDVAPYLKTGMAAEDLPHSERKKYSVMLLLDVVEHIAEPQVFIQSLMAAFPNVHTLIVTVPAGQALWSNYDEFYGHLRRYDLAMLEQLSRDMGGDLTQCRYFFHTLFLPALLLSLFNKERSVRLIPPKGFKRSLHSLMSLLMRIEYACIPGSFPGSSALASIRINKVN